MENKKEFISNEFDANRRVNHVSKIEWIPITA